MITTMQVAADMVSLSAAIPLPSSMQLPINAYRPLTTMLREHTRG